MEIIAVLRSIAYKTVGFFQPYLLASRIAFSQTRVAVFACAIRRCALLRNKEIT